MRQGKVKGKSRESQEQMTFLRKVKGKSREDDFPLTLSQEKVKKMKGPGLSLTFPQGKSQGKVKEKSDPCPRLSLNGMSRENQGKVDLKGKSDGHGGTRLQGEKEATSLSAWKKVPAPAAVPAWPWQALEGKGRLHSKNTGRYLFVSSACTELVLVK